LFQTKSEGFKHLFQTKGEQKEKVYMPLGYWIRKRQDCNWFYKNTEEEIIVAQAAQMGYTPGYLALYTSSARSLAISRGFSPPDIVVETDYTYYGTGFGYPESASPTLVPDSHVEQHNEYKEAPPWPESWNFGGFFVSYYEQYYTEVVDWPGVVVPPSVVFSPWFPTMSTNNGDLLQNILSGSQISLERPRKIIPDT
jgi:hypothetical protein